MTNSRYNFVCFRCVYIFTGNKGEWDKHLERYAVEDCLGNCAQNGPGEVKEPPSPVAAQ